jgi:hypothetical protein
LRMSDGGIYKCDVNNFIFLLSVREKGLVTDNDWFYWWLEDNGIDYKMVEEVVYNEFQETIYVSEIDNKNLDFCNGKIKIRHRCKGVFSMSSYPVVEKPPQILMDRWEQLMEDFYGPERSLCSA